MEEHIFGTVLNDELKLAHHRINNSGLQHAHRIEPLHPAPDEPIDLRVLVGPDLPVDRVACYYTLDGSQPQGSRGNAENGRVIELHMAGATWDSILWGYVSRWRAELPGQPEGAQVKYRIGAWQQGGGEVMAEWPDAKRSIERVATAFFHDEPLDVEWAGDAQQGTTFSLRVEKNTPPDWTREAVIYQIFVDRFSPGQGKPWMQTGDLNDFFGGTLYGVAENLDHIASLGADCIWLSPIFPSPTTHGYDTTDYFDVEARLGGRSALSELVDKAHSLGIRVILDLVCNHMSHLHPIFQEAKDDRGSKYRDWFVFDDSRIGYRTFFGVPSMPELNLENEDARDWMLEVAQYWLREFDVDGYRLDHANGPGPSFWTDFTKVCVEEKEDVFCFGEVVEPAGVVRRYTGRLHGTLDFLFADAVRKTFGYRTSTEGEFRQFLRAHSAYFRSDLLQLTFIDNHDMDRFLYVADGDKDKLKRAVSLQMTQPGPPIIYYGTEIGLSQNNSRNSQIGLDATRIPMVWDERQDLELFDFYRAKIDQRAVNQPWAVVHGAE